MEVVAPRGPAGDARLFSVAHPFRAARGRPRSDRVGSTDASQLDPVLECAVSRPRHGDRAFPGPDGLERRSPRPSRLRVVAAGAPMALRAATLWRGRPA